MPLLEQQVRLQYRLLGHEGHYTRVRWDDKQTGKGGKEDLVAGVDSLIKWARPLCGKFNMYLSRNPFTKEGNVASVSSFTMDIDPVREPKDRASTQAELEKAISCAKQAASWLGDGCTFAVSGNGVLAIHPFTKPVEDVEAYTAQAQAFERELIKRFSTNEVRIDGTNYARALLKLLGSVSTKGDPKSHRYARTIGPVLFRGSDRLLQRIRTNPVSVAVKPKLPVSHGDYLSRSEAEIALANRLQLSGLDAPAILKALQEYGFRPERKDDHERIVAKLFANGSGVVSNVHDGQQPVAVSPLWTPGDRAGDRVVTISNEGLSTGFKWLDSRLFGGWLRGRVYAIEAPTNLGKSTFIVQAAHHLSRLGKRVLLVATEMDQREFEERCYALGTGLPASKVFALDATAEHKQHISRFADEFRQYPLFVRFTDQPNTQQTERDIEEVKPDIVLWDYFQHMDTGLDNRQVQLGKFARWFESTAIKYDIPFVVAAQLHEHSDFKTGKRMPANKNHIKDCKVLNDVAKTVIVLDWEPVDTEDGPVGVVVDLQKNKGPMGRTKIVLQRHIPRFIDL